MAPKTDQGRKYHETATGDALPTVQLHEKDAPITLFGSCFCPFGQRVWAALEFYGIEYKVGAH
jgi:glutathione S-transferase